MHNKQVKLSIFIYQRGVKSVQDLVLARSDGCLRLLYDDLLSLTLLTLELKSLTSLQLNLTRLNQLDLHIHMQHTLMNNTNRYEPHLQ